MLTISTSKHASDATQLFSCARLVSSGCVAVAALLLGGCAGNNPEALAAANHATKLMSAMNENVVEARRVELASEKSQTEALASRDATLLKLQQVTNGLVSARVAAGDTQMSALLQKLAKETETISTRRVDASERKATYAGVLAALAKPLPEASPLITAAQSKAALMGIELDWRTRVGEAEDFSKALKTSFDENKAKVDAAIKDAQKADETGAKASAAASTL